MPAITAKRLLLLTALPAALLAGCQRQFRLEFVNETAEPRQLVLAAPGHGSIPLGQIDGGGQLTHKLGMRPDYLPARCWWQADELSGNFVLTGERQGTVLVPICRAAQDQQPTTQPTTQPGQVEASNWP